MIALRASDWVEQVRAAAAGTELFAFLQRRLTKPYDEGPLLDDRRSEGVEDVFVELARQDDGFRARLEDTIANYFRGDDANPADADAPPVIRGLLEITGVLSLPGCASHVRAWLARHDATLRAEPDALLGRAALGALATLPGSVDASDFWLRVWQSAPPAWQPRAFMGLRLHDPRAAAEQIPVLLQRAETQTHGARALLFGMWKQPEGRTAMLAWLKAKAADDADADKVRRVLRDMLSPEEQAQIGPPRVKRRLRALALSDESVRVWGP